MGPEDSHAWDALSWALAYEQPPEAVEAEKAAREAIRLQPSLTPAFYHLGRALVLQGRYEEATKAFERAGELGDLQYADFGQAQIYLAQGNYDAAIARVLKGGEPKEAVNAYLLSAAYAAKLTKRKPWLSCKRLSTLVTAILPPSKKVRILLPCALTRDSSNSSGSTISNWDSIPVPLRAGSRFAATVLIFFIAGLLFICASSTSITWERTASRRRPAFSSHLVMSTIRTNGFGPMRGSGEA